jgi:hypothetical protein
MNSNIIKGSIITLLGLFIAFGPQFLVKACPSVMVQAMPSEVSIDGCGGCGCSGNSPTALSEVLAEGCGSGGLAGSFSICYWSARAEIGIGMLIAALGLCLLIFNDPKTQLGLLIGVFMSGIVAIGIPYALIGGCNIMSMACRSVTFPAITIVSVILLVYTAILVVFSEMRSNSA